MKSNNKGFTLTELLVVVVILGIITGISIPLIRGLSASFEKKKYTNYADSVLSASKLYNDSYNEDLFGHKEYGCAYIRYNDLVERNLLKDIQITNISCNSENTYVRVIKQKDKYGYSNYLSCGKKVNGKASNVTTSIPSVIPEIDENSCSGVSDNNLLISADEKEIGNVFNKKRKKTKLTITSGTGINNNVVIYTKWSTNRNDYSDTGFNKTTFKVKGNQEKELLNGNLITTTSSELLTPEGESGAYYLIVRVDNLFDLYGSKWKNPDKTESKYVSFGPFSIDNIKPTVPLLKGYKKKDSNDVSTIAGLRELASNTWYNGWLALMASGSTDNSGKVTYYYTVTGASTNVVNNPSPTGVRNVNAHGESIIKVKACDAAKNCSSEAEYKAKLDRIPPTCGKATNASTTWTKSSRTIKQACSDSDSKCVKASYDSTYSTTKKTASVTISDNAGNTKNCSYNVYVDTTPPTCGKATNASTTWTKSSRTIKQACSDSDSQCVKASYDSTYSTTKKTASVTISDKVGNTSVCSYNVYVDTTPPTCGTATNASTTWTNQNRTIKQACSDSDSQCVKASYDTTYSTDTMTSSVTISDNAGNTKSCSYNVYVDKTPPEKVEFVYNGHDGGGLIQVGDYRYHYPTQFIFYCSDSLSGTNKDSVNIVFNDNGNETGWRNPEGNIEWEPPVGGYVIKEICRDNAGNEKNQLWQYEIVSQPSSGGSSSGGGSGRCKKTRNVNKSISFTWRDSYSCSGCGEAYCRWLTGTGGQCVGVTKFCQARYGGTLSSCNYNAKTCICNYTTTETYWGSC